MRKAILVLGGTADARRIADTLILDGYKVIYSVAALLRAPKLDCDIVSGGFSQFGGLTQYLNEHSIGLVVNATHPYAAQMSCKAVAASIEAKVQIWHLLRPAWQPTEQDLWHTYRNEEELLTMLSGYQRPLLSAGKMTQSFIHNVASTGSIKQVLWRTASLPNFDLPTHGIWEKAVGPFDREEELALLKHFQIDVIVSKNTGGATTSAKLEAARELSIPVLLHQRPKLAQATCTFKSVSELISALRRQYPMSSALQQRGQQ